MVDECNFVRLLTKLQLFAMMLSTLAKMIDLCRECICTLKNENIENFAFDTRRKQRIRYHRNDIGRAYRLAGLCIADK